MAGAIRDERGVALVMAMLTLLILSVLVLAFSLLSSTEPSIASNLLRVAQARALAEAGLERTIWALGAGRTAHFNSTSLPTGGIAYQWGLGATAAAPYDGSQLLSISTGGNTIGGVLITAVEDSSDPHLVAVTAVGYVPTNDATDTRTKAHQKIVASVIDFPKLTRMPCAVCVRGDIQIGGTSTINARPQVGDDATSCGTLSGPGGKYGTWSTTVKDSSGTTISPGNTTIGSGASKIYGAVDGNNTANQATDMAVRQNQADFDKNALTNSGLDLLKAYAKAHGTYYQGTASVPTVAFSTTNKLPDGIVFVDTISGNDITSTTSTSDYASVTITGNASANAAGFHGWIVVNGSLSISGSFTMYGLVYAVNDLSYVGTGGQITGQLISANVKDTIATVIDTSISGVASVQYNCSATQSPVSGIIPSGYIVKSGSYKEVSD